jgi:hypothetical protein
MANVVRWQKAHNISDFSVSVTAAELQKAIDLFNDRTFVDWKMNGALLLSNTCSTTGFNIGGGEIFSW